MSRSRWRTDSRDKGQEVVTKLFLKQVEDGVGLAHDVKEVDLRLLLWVC